MSIIARYITRNFLITFFVVLIFTIFLFVLSDFSSRLGSILKSSVSFKYVVEYYVFYTPFIVYFSLPFIFALSSLISLGYLSFRNEIIVMRASGLSIFRIAKPVFILSIILAVVMFFGKEKVVNYSLDKANYIKSFYIEKDIPNYVWMKVGPFFVRADRINLKAKEFSKVVCYKVKYNFSDIEDVIKAKKGIFKDKRLILYDVKDTVMPNRNVKFYKKLILKSKTPFVSLLSTSKFKEPSLKKLLEGFKIGKDRNFYLSLVLSRFLYPLSCLVLTLISLVFVLKITPRKSGFISNVFYGAVTFLIYVIGFQLTTTMGKYSMINPTLSFLIFILFWIAISLYNLLKLGI